MKDRLTLDEIKELREKEVAVKQDLETAYHIQQQVEQEMRKRKKRKVVLESNKKYVR